MKGPDDHAPPGYILLCQAIEQDTEAEALKFAKWVCRPHENAVAVRGCYRYVDSKDWGLRTHFPDQGFMIFVPRERNDIRRS